MALKAKDTRKKKNPEYKSFKLRKRIKPSNFKPLPSAWWLWKDSTKFLLANWQKVSAFLLIYTFLYVVFVRGLGSAIDFAGLKESLNSNGQSANGIVRSLILFGVLVGSANAVSSEVAALYQSILFVVGSLAFIWLIRALSGKNKNSIRVKDSFYLGMQPLFPVLGVVAVIIVQAIPLSIAGYLLSVGLGTAGIAFIEVLVFVILASLVSLISFYLISGSWAAIYIATLPGAEPIKSIRAANKLISVHRWQTMRRLFALVAFMLISAVILIVPLLLFIPDGYEYIAEYGFFIYLIIGFSIAHTYLYKLYKSFL